MAEQDVARSIPELEKLFGTEFQSIVLNVLRPTEPVSEPESLQQEFLQDRMALSICGEPTAWIQEAITVLPQPTVVTASDVARVLYYCLAGQLTPESRLDSPEFESAFVRSHVLLSGELEDSFDLARSWEFDGRHSCSVTELAFKQFYSRPEHEVLVSFPPAAHTTTSISDIFCEANQDWGCTPPWKHPIWTSNSGFELWLLPGCRHENSFEYSTGEFVIEATATKAALDAGQQQINTSLHSIVRTAVDACTADQKGMALDQGILQMVATLRYFHAGDGGVLLRTCLDAVFSVAVSDLDRRIQNSVSLLANSDVIDHAGVSLALCTAAIESLLTNPGDKVTEVFANSCATLLQPDTDCRQQAIGDLKRLFDYRSSVLHGRSVTADSQLRGQSRRLAAGILRAVACLKNQYKLRGKELSRKELRSMIELCNLDNRPVPGLSDLSELLPTNVPKLVDP
jgi:hypothetical protein